MNGGELHPALRQSLFIAGTDTGVGKTWVATRLLAALVEGGHRVAGMKPVAAGAELTAQGLRYADALDLAAAGNVRLPYALTNPV
jgi:dethiobiotin synthetase